MGLVRPVHDPVPYCGPVHPRVEVNSSTPPVDEEIEEGDSKVHVQPPESQSGVIVED